MRRFPIILSALIIAGVTTMVSCDSKNNAVDNDYYSENRITIDVKIPEVVNVAICGDVNKAAFANKLDRKSYLNDTSFAFDYIAEDDTQSVLDKLELGKYDIAAVPADTAVSLYSRVDSDYKILCINTVSELNFVENGSSVFTPADLAGKTVLIPDNETTKELLNYTLSTASLTSDSVAIEILPDETACFERLNAVPGTVSVLSDDFNNVNTASIRTAFTLKNATGIDVVTGVTVVRNAFLQEHPDAVKAFLAENDSSDDDLESDDYAKFYTGIQMQEMLKGYYRVTLKSVPGDEFYYTIDE